MDEFDGSLRQRAMNPSPATRHFAKGMTFPLRGKIMPNGVRYRDQNAGKQTLVDVFLYDRYPMITNVPIAHAKMSRENGEEWTPEPGDLVLVQFIGGNFRDPIITGYLSPASNEIEADAADAPRCHRRMNGTWEKIEKNGTRRTHVAKDDVLEVEGDGTITVHGNVTVHIYGTADVTVDGETTVVTPSATVRASEKVTLDTPLTECTGNLAVAGGITAAGTYGESGGNITTPGDIQSTGGNVSDSVRSMAEDRGIFNDHDHNDPQGGVTPPPNQQM